MSDDIFELINRLGVIRRNKLDWQRIARLTSIDIGNFVYRSMELTSTEILTRENSPFVFTASLPLSGAPTPCVGLDCRQRNLRQLAQFAALYSDRVYILNFLSGIVNPHEGEFDSMEELQVRFADDLELLLYLRPLIESKHVVLVTPATFCPFCLMRSLGQNIERHFSRALSRMSKRYHEEVIASVQFEDGEYCLEYDAPEYLLEHGQAMVYAEKPFSFLNEMPRIREKVENGFRVKLSHNAKKRYMVGRRLAQEALENIAFGMSTSQCVNSAFLSQRDLDVDLLKDISNDQAITERNRILHKHLNSMVPFIQNVRPSDLVKLRHTEAEAFVLFRNALSKAIDETRKQKQDFTERDAQQIYGDILEPELARLNSRVKTAGKSLIKDPICKIVTWAAGITIGTYFGLIPSDLHAAAQALGLVRVIQEIYASSLFKGSPEDSIRNEGMYFLWKAQTLQKGPKRPQSRTEQSNLK